VPLLPTLCASNVMIPMSMYSIVISAALVSRASLTSADDPTEKSDDVAHQHIEQIAGATEAMTDDLTALFQSARVGAANHPAEEHAEEMDMALSANSVANAGPQESVVLEAMLPSPPLAHMHGHEELTKDGIKNQVLHMEKPLVKAAEEAPKPLPKPMLSTSENLTANEPETVADNHPFHHAAVHSLLDTMHHAAHHHPQEALSFGSMMLLGVVIVIFAALYPTPRDPRTYSFEKSMVERSKKAMFTQPPACDQPAETW